MRGHFGHFQPYVPSLRKKCALGSAQRETGSKGEHIAESVRTVQSVRAAGEINMTTKPKISTADALLQIGISPNVADANLEPANLVDAIAQVGGALRTAAKWLGNGEAATPMGALEAHGKAILDASENIAAAIRDLADAIRESR